METISDEMMKMVRLSIKVDKDVLAFEDDPRLNLLTYFDCLFCNAAFKKFSDKQADNIIHEFINMYVGSGDDSQEFWLMKMLNEYKDDPDSQHDFQLCYFYAVKTICIAEDQCPG